LSDVGKTHLHKSFHCFGEKQNIVSFKSHLPLRKSEISDLVHFDDNAGFVRTST